MEAVRGPISEAPATRRVKHAHLDLDMLLAVAAAFGLVALVVLGGLPHLVASLVKDLGARSERPDRRG